MFRTLDMALVAIMIAAAAMTYKIKHDSEDRLAEIRKLRIAIQQEKDSVELLRADWSLLTQPARLQKLAERYAKDLQLQPLGARAIVGADELPTREQGIEDIINSQGGIMVKRGDATDPTTTGGTGQ
ncbi:MAG: hypothetical protein IPL47_08550 [Phyllobacteriaceae bacterium]|nr:hypothetical protein [Phyllobacteriaceae bacterium]